MKIIQFLKSLFLDTVDIKNAPDEELTEEGLEIEKAIIRLEKKTEEELQLKVCRSMNTLRVKDILYNLPESTSNIFHVT